MNGYAGRVQELLGRFSANRDRGVLVPREGVKVPDLTYLRFVMEPQLTAAAVGRRVDGRANDYTKLYPETAVSVTVPIPLKGTGKWDYTKMVKLGSRFRRIEAAQAGVRKAQEPLLKAVFAVEVPEPCTTISLGDPNRFTLSIGKRVLRADHVEDGGVPVYSANSLAPFGNVAKSNLADFKKPSLLWGIDGNFDWNLIPANEVFATTDHCGRLQIVDSNIDPEYVYWFLRMTRYRYGFDRVYRANLDNIAGDATVTLPLDDVGVVSLAKQRVIAEDLRARERSREAATMAMNDVLTARVALV